MNFSTFLLENGPEDIDSPVWLSFDQVAVAALTEIIIDIHQRRQPQSQPLVETIYASTVKRIAVGLQDIGVAKSDCVAVASRNGIYYYILGNGITAVGGVFAPVSAFAKPVEMDHQLQVTYADWIFVEPEFLDQVVAAAERVGIPKSKIVIFDAQESTNRQGYKTFAQLLQSDESKYRPLHLTGDEPCDRYLTSGSTGLPKAAGMCHKAMIARVKPYMALPTPNPISSNRNLHFIDMHHISGWFNNTFTAIGKQTYYVLRRTDALSIVDTIDRFKITQSMVHPRMVEEIVVLMQKGVRDRSALASLDQVKVAGSVVRGDYLDLLLGFMRDGACATISYGATEISTMAAVTPGMKRYPGYVGKPPPGMEVIIVDPETLKELPSDVDGEICSRSPNMFTGYVNNREATAKALITLPSGTWLRTGDRGHWSSSFQQLAITGRYKETFKVGTEEVAPEEVEAELLKRPGISDVALTSTDARPGQGGLEPLAYIVAPDRSISAQEIVDHIANAFTSCKAPTGGVVFCETIPRTSFGKIQRGKINALMEKATIEDRSARFLTPKTDMSHL